VNDIEDELALVVRSRTPVADGVLALELSAEDGSALPAWSPGAHIDLVLDEEAKLVRQYSLCGDPARTDVWRIAVLREPNGRGGSTHVHDRVQSGSVLRGRGPRNHFRLEEAAGYLFIAGGVGITPILPMVAAAEAAGASWRLVYGGRTSTSMTFADELRHAYGDRVTLCPEDEYGLLDLAALLADPEPGTLVYCCGPGGLLDAVEGHCSHWPTGTLRMERFTPKEQAEPVLIDAFEVELAASNMTVTVPPDRSILEVVEEAGVSVLSSCQEGTCGTCETRLISGEVEHRDSVLTEDERATNETMLICVSRAAGPRLVLDL
jgi:ferredoxin-NADP reductase